MSTPAAAFARLLEVLDRMEIAYHVGGSVASSAHGVPRTTMDVDLVVDLKREQIEAFASDLQNDFYADAELIREAFARGRRANLIHLRAAWKFDLFPLASDAYSQTAFRRREAIECAVATAEDTILRKLEWYRAGAETSERQWRQWSDLRGICAAAGQPLDVGYLRKWAAELRVDDLLETLLAE